MRSDDVLKLSSRQVRLLLEERQDAQHERLWHALRQRVAKLPKLHGRRTDHQEHGLRNCDESTRSLSRDFFGSL